MLSKIFGAAAAAGREGHAGAGVRGVSPVGGQRRGRTWSRDCSVCGTEGGRVTEWNTRTSVVAAMNMLAKERERERDGEKEGEIGEVGEIGEREKEREGERERERESIMQNMGEIGIGG